MSMVRDLDLDGLVLMAGSHPNPAEGMCLMEAVAFVAGEPHSDHPECASPVLGEFLRRWNDDLPVDERQDLKRYIPRLVGSRGTEEQEEQRSLMALDWLVRVQAPAWLRLAPGLSSQADTLAGLGEVAAGSVSSTASVLMAALEDADAYLAATRGTLLTTSSVGDAAGDAYLAAAGDAAGDAAGAAHWDAYLAAARAAAQAAARAASMSAARAAEEALEPTVRELQSSAHDLIDRMLSVGPVPTPTPRG